MLTSTSFVGRDYVLVGVRVRKLRLWVIGYLQIGGSKVAEVVMFLSVAYHFS